jgi:hypothetical protein
MELKGSTLCEAIDSIYLVERTGRKNRVPYGLVSGRTSAGRDSGGIARLMAG